MRHAAIAGPARWALAPLLAIGIGCSASEFSGGGGSKKADASKSSERDDAPEPASSDGAGKADGADGKDGAEGTGTSGQPSPDGGGEAGIETSTDVLETQEARDAASIKAALDNMRWNLPCTGSNSGKVCTTDATVDDSKVLSGDGKTLFNITLRFRGIVEPKPYTGGTNDGAYWQIGGQPSGDAWNIYKLEISSPPQVYFLNRAAATGFNNFNIDYQKTVQAYGGSTFHISADSRDNAEISNHERLTVPGIEDAPYNGQFIHIGVVKIEAEKAAP